MSDTHAGRRVGAHEIRFCGSDEKAALKAFIDQHWRRGHILSSNDKLLDWQHLDRGAGRYNFVVAESTTTGHLEAVLGFIPLCQYDPALKQGDVWLAIWKEDQRSVRTPGLGLELLSFLTSALQPVTIGAIGINEDVKRLYRLLGYSVGAMAHYWFADFRRMGFRLLGIDRPDPRSAIDSKVVLRRDPPWADIEALASPYRPKKSAQYVRGRFLNHPVYSYQVYGVYQDGRCAACMVCRLAEGNGARCIRIVDALGDLAEVRSLQDELSRLLLEHKAEYVDCLNYGIDQATFLRLGLLPKPPGMVIPNHFEPFTPTNADIQVAFKPSDLPYCAFKADSDQDRPSIYEAVR